MIAAHKGYEACSGCSLCLLACPVWRATHDLRLTPHGRAKALQHGAKAADVAASVDACTLCGACEPACPEGMALVAMTTDLRAELAQGDPGRVAGIVVDFGRRPSTAPDRPGASALVAGQSLARYPDILRLVAGALVDNDGTGTCTDDGADISLALEAGAAVPPARRTAFLDALRGARRLVVADGVLIRALRDWLPGARIESLGAVLSAIAAVRSRLRAEDYYVIEPRAYHAEQDRLVKYYDAMRVALGLNMNLDLQRMAIPTTAGSWQAGRPVVDPQAQARWMLEGVECARVVVEDPADIAVFSAVTDKPVLHLAQLG